MRPLQEAHTELPDESGRQVDANLVCHAPTTTVNEYSVAYLLAVLQRVDPEAADRAACDLASVWDSGDTTGEWAYQWRDEPAQGRPITLHGFAQVDLPEVAS